MTLAQVEFSYNDCPNRSTSFSPFYISYDMYPKGIFELRNQVDIERRITNGEDFAKVAIKIVY